MKKLLQKMDVVKSLGLALSPFLLLAVLVGIQSLWGDSFRSATLSMFLPGKTPEVPHKIPVRMLASGSGLLTPISLVDEAFAGYDRVREASSPAGDKKGKAAVAEAKRPEPVPVRAAQPVVAPVAPAAAVAPEAAPKVEARAGAGHDAVKAGTGFPVRKPVVASPGGNAPDTGRGHEDLHDRYLAMVSERAAAAGLPDAKKNEMLRSFQDLSNIMPPEDAWKVVRLRIRDQAAR